MGMFLIGYDVECGTPGDHFHASKNVEMVQKETEKFVSTASAIHESYKIPATFFICGDLLSKTSDIFKAHVENPYLDFQQHTWSHKSLKPAVVTHNGRVDLFDWPTAVTLDEIRWEIGETNKLFKEKLGITCRGLSTPFAYFMGLADRPDILKILHEEGIEYFRSFHLNKEELSIREPLPFEYHPFSHPTQGFPTMIDFCIKGYSDVTWALRFGWDAADGFVSYIKQALHLIETSDYVWTLVLHDWSMMKISDSLAVVDEILHYITKNLDLEVLTFDSAYDKLLKSPMIAQNMGRTVDWKINVNKLL